MRRALARERCIDPLNASRAWEAILAIFPITLFILGSTSM
jgi:hypothetical protein